MRSALIAAVLVVGGCAAQSPQVQQAMTVACNADGIVVPLGQQVVGQLGSAGALASGVDQLLVHPLVVQECDKLKAKPVAVPATTPAEPPAKPIS